MTRLSSLRLITPTGSFVELAEIATIEQRLGFSVVRRRMASRGGVQERAG